MACSISSVPTTRSSVADTGRFTKEVVLTWAGICDVPSKRSLHSVHQVPGLSGSQPKRQSLTTFTLGRSAASAREAVDLAVRGAPRIKTPPMRVSTAFRMSARLMRSCPTMAVNGKIGGIYQLQTVIITRDSVFPKLVHRKNEFPIKVNEHSAMV